MARLYLDNNVSRDVQRFLLEYGHDVQRARQFQGMHRATDAYQLLFAVQLGAVMITHDRADFMLLHDAWRRCPDAWGGHLDHHGILILLQERSPQNNAASVHERLIDGSPLRNELHEWRSTGGWVHRSYTR